MNPRVIAAKAVVEVLDAGRSLSTALPPLLNQAAPADRALVQELCYGVLRWQLRLAAIVPYLLHKPLKARDQDIYALVLLGLYQLLYMRIPDHAAVTETVSACRALKKDWAAGVVNAVLRNFLRAQTQILAQVDSEDAVACAHPAWLLTRLKQAWPTQWRAMVEANNQRAPMTLRVNGRALDRDRYLARLTEAGLAARPAPHTTHGLVLEKPVDVSRLPGFAEGLVSVQDAGAQLAAPLLEPQAGERILDACAAPGGKACHILELQPRLQALVAVDQDAKRLERVQENLERLQLKAQVLAADAADTAAWWDGQVFDRILLDAPCSASGVIRRHPDIKLLRRAEDITALAATQTKLLNALWPVLRPGGMLLYVTCSVLPEENDEPIRRFLLQHPEAQVVPITAAWGVARDAGRQILPGDQDMDGFYYARLHKPS